MENGKVNVETGEVKTVSRERPRVQFATQGPSMTRQEFKEECDLAKTIKRFAKSPEGALALKNAQGYAPDSKFEDVSAVPDYRTARDLYIAASAKFMALPAIVRRRFDNDAALFLDFVRDPKNLDELRSMGLAKPALQDAAKAPLPVKG